MNVNVQTLKPSGRIL